MSKLICILTLFSSLAIAANLSTIENQIREYVVSEKAAQISLLKQIVNINSGTTNVAGVREVGEMLRPHFEQLGFKTHWEEEPANMKRAGTLIAERKGNQGKRLLLIGHLDTVFPANNPFKPFTLSKKTAKGQGTMDDKGGVLVMLQALKALNSVYALDNTTITIVLTGDEEDSGKPTSISRKPLRDVAIHSDIALDFEPSINLDSASVARRGISQWTIEVKGNESHSATIFQRDVGVGAIFELSRILNTMRDQLAPEKHLSFNPGLILGGTKIHFDNKNALGDAFGKQNVVSKIAIVTGDLRFSSPEQKQSAELKMSAIVNDHLPGTKTSISFQDGIPAMPPTQNNLNLLKTYSVASFDLGHGSVAALDAGVRGAGDISHVAAIVPANLAGLGPTGWGSHSVIEEVNLDSLLIQSERAAILIYRLTRNV